MDMEYQENNRSIVSTVMNLKAGGWIWLLVSAVCLGGGIWLFQRSPFWSLVAIYSTPIEFYGKVVNQHGDPVEGAVVKISPFESFVGEDVQTRIVLESDHEGRFSAKDLKGKSLSVNVTKDGYMTRPPLGPDKPFSHGLFEFGSDSKKGSRYKDPNHPTIFTLHEIGPLEPMVYVKSKRWKLPVDGSPVQIALDSDDGKGSHRIEFRFRSGWNQLPKDNDINKKRFDWTFEAKIPGGGFRANPSEYQLEAPEGGYEEAIKIEYSADMPIEEWKKVGYGRYFVKFPDGSFGRIRFSIDGSSDRMPLSMASWLNLKPGSRNLASDKWDPTVVSD